MSIKLSEGAVSSDEFHQINGEIRATAGCEDRLLPGIAAEYASKTDG